MVVGLNVWQLAPDGQASLGPLGSPGTSSALTSEGGIWRVRQMEVGSAPKEGDPPPKLVVLLFGFPLQPESGASSMKGKAELELFPEPSAVSRVLGRARPPCRESGGLPASRNLPRGRRINA